MSINIKSLLNYIINIIDRAHRMHIQSSEDIIVNRVYNLISNKQPISDEDLKKLNADILKLRELMND